MKCKHTVLRTRVVGVLTLLMAVEVIVAAGGRCRCGSVTFIDPNTLCSWHNVPKCDPVENDHLGCYYCSDCMVQITITCPGQDPRTAPAMTCRTDDGYSCGDQIVCGCQ